MIFKPHETLTVTHDYTLGVSYDAMGQIWVDYVLKTGRLWKDEKIGHTFIEVVPGVPTRLCSEVSKTVYPELKPQPAGMKIVGQGKERRYIWDRSQFKPKKDLRLCLKTGRDFVRYDIVYRILDNRINVAQLSAKQRSLLKNTIYAQYGRAFKKPALQAYFDAQWWYHENPNYHDGLLTASDKKAIAKILAASP